jgi:hypothetical protein
VARKRSSPKRQARRTVLLVTNGEITEKQYLDELKRFANRDKSLSVTVKPIARDPLGVLKKLASPQGDLSAFDEVWIIVDHDGTDRTDFLKRCHQLSTRTTQVNGIVSVPCFEVWLLAHYKQVGFYPDQEAAKRELAAETHRHRDTKELPSDFPWENLAEACERCCLVNEALPGLNEQGNSTSTGMPHLIYSLKLSEPRQRRS